MFACVSRSETNLLPLPDFQVFISLTMTIWWKCYSVNKWQYFYYARSMFLFSIFFFVAFAFLG